jgi:hypothetical protein
LFVEPLIYEYGLLDELAVNAYWVERYAECLDACERLLHDGKMPEEMRERVEMNARFAREKLAPQPQPIQSKALERICAAAPIENADSGIGSDELGARHAGIAVAGLARAHCRSDFVGKPCSVFARLRDFKYLLPLIH